VNKFSIDFIAENKTKISLDHFEKTNSAIFKDNDTVEGAGLLFTFNTQAGQAIKAIWII
jgi:hypothetical protein